MITEQIGSYQVFIQGFSGAQLRDPEKMLINIRRAFEGVDIQLLRADRVAGKEHLVFAAKNAIDSFKGKKRRAKHLSMEFLLSASGEHQIVEAVKLLGVAPSTEKVALVALSDKLLNVELLTGKVAEALNGTPDDAVVYLEDPKKILSLRRAYGISEREIDSARVPGETEQMVLQRLVIERSAVLGLEN